MNETDLEKGLRIFIFATCVVFLAFIFMIIYAPFMNRPVQAEQVEVIGKRIRQTENFDSGKRNDYIVAFKFSDGSVKELEVGSGRSYSSTGREVYDSIHEGDKGMLTYKEIKDIGEKYKNENTRYFGRYFYSFEKN